MGDRSRSVETKFGQITPPDDDWKTNWRPETTMDPSVPTSAAAEGQGHGREDSSSSTSSPPSEPLQFDTATATHRPRRAGGNEKTKYREKNRVAAAKCRAKKKEHTDGLEESHRTQSMLNSLLKQTEQNLRDELSFWRTQALQHAYCDCTSIQEYNLRKAKALATDKVFGGTEQAQSSAAAQTLDAGDGRDQFFAMQHSTSNF